MKYIFKTYYLINKYTLHDDVVDIAAVYYE